MGWFSTKVGETRKHKGKTQGYGWCEKCLGTGHRNFLLKDGPSRPELIVEKRGQSCSSCNGKRKKWHDLPEGETSPSSCWLDCDYYSCKIKPVRFFLFDPREMSQTVQYAPEGTEIYQNFRGRGHAACSHNWVFDYSGNDSKHPRQFYRCSKCNTGGVAEVAGGRISPL